MLALTLSSLYLSSYRRELAGWWDLSGDHLGNKMKIKTLNILKALTAVLLLGQNALSLSILFSSTPKFWGESYDKVNNPHFPCLLHL